MNKLILFFIVATVVALVSEIFKILNTYVIEDSKKIKQNLYFSILFIFDFEKLDFVKIRIREHEYAKLTFDRRGSNKLEQVVLYDKIISRKKQEQII